MKYAASIFALLFLLACVPQRTYQPVEPNYQLTFPRDHYAHPDFRTEWWYYTGHLETDDQRVYGFELVFFRRYTEGDYRWSLPVWWFSNPAHVSHFAISDITDQEFAYEERIGMRGPFYGGARSDRFHIWSEGWQAVELNGTYYLSADMGGYAIDLALSPAKPVVLHGENGYSRKGDGSTASYYMSYTRLRTSGWLREGNQWLRISGGSAWMDHEIFSTALDEQTGGWDWFSMQLDDNTEVMLYALNSIDGQENCFEAGTYINEAGEPIALYDSDISIAKKEYWTSPATGARYPIKWEIALRSLDLKVNMRASIPHSELVMPATDVNYWEGAVEIQGQKKGQPITGRGYVEMSGRDQPINVF